VFAFFHLVKQFGLLLQAQQLFFLFVRPGGVVGLFDVKPDVRISAIVDACFKLIVDGVSAPSWTRRDARKRGINVSQTPQCRRATSMREAMAFEF
jgi:hypothetical protein